MIALWRWSQPADTSEVVSWLGSLPSSELIVVMESSGTYGDPLRERLEESGIEVQQALPKQARDAREVWDRVPSLHDAKAAVILARLGLQGLCAPWRRASKKERALRARLQVLDLHDRTLRRHVNRLEALLGRHWPEVVTLLELDAATLLELLLCYGGPRGVAAEVDQARRRMRRVGGYFLKQEKIEAVLSSARTSTGVEMVAAEEHLVREVAGEIRRLQKRIGTLRRELEKEALRPEWQAAELAAVLGPITALLVISFVGHPQSYPSSAAYLHALGLNLAAIQSGKRKGQIGISKRGPGIARRWLYFAVLRWIQNDSLASAWYRSKVRRDGGRKQIALIALMRKLVRACWHVGSYGVAFDSSLLFDRRRLERVA
jgi:transposase